MTRKLTMVNMFVCCNWFHYLWSLHIPVFRTQGVMTWYYFLSMWTDLDWICFGKLKSLYSFYTVFACQSSHICQWPKWTINGEILPSNVDACEDGCIVGVLHHLISRNWQTFQSCLLCLKTCQFLPDYTM